MNNRMYVVKSSIFRYMDCLSALLIPTADSNVNIGFNFRYQLLNLMIETKTDLNQPKPTKVWQFSFLAFVFLLSKPIEINPRFDS